MGNPLTLTDPEGVTEYSYDNLDRLPSARRIGPSTADVLETYAYNTLGAVSDNGGVTLNTQRPRLVGSGTADSAMPATYAGQPITLGPTGNVTAFRELSLSTNFMGRLYEARKTVNGTVKAQELGFDPEMRVISRIGYDVAGSTRTQTSEEYYVNDEFSNIAGVVRFPGTTPQMQEAYLFEGTDAPLRVGFLGGAYAFYELDLAGNVRRLRASGGADLGGYRYSAFGKDIAPSATTPAPSMNQPLRWKARWRDEFLGGVYDMRARWWAPEIAAFLEVDQLEYHDARSTLFGWPHQNPMRWSDPTGRYGIIPTWVDNALLAAEESGALRTTASFAAGVSNVLTLGVSGAAFRWTGVNSAYDQCSTAYRVGEYAGYGLGIAELGASLTKGGLQGLKALARDTRGGLRINAASIAKAERSIVNNIRDHLKPSDLAGAVRDQLGNPVRGNFGTYNHAKEVGDALAGLRKSADVLEGVADPAARALRQEALEAIKAAEEALKGLGI